MSIIVDPETSIVEPQDSSQTIAPGNPPLDDGLPDKFKGKSAKDIADAYQSLESELGRARNEIGTTRRLADELLGIRKEEMKANQPARKPITSTDLLDSPEETITEAVNRASEAATADLRKATARLEADLELRGFEQRHPGYEGVIASPEFRTWVTKSQYRQGLATKAARNDFTAADELFGLYEDTKNVAAPNQSSPDPVKAPSAKTVGFAKSGGSTPAGGSSAGSGGKPILRREELIRLRIDNPDEFDRRNDEIMLAYAEKRVR